MNRELSVNCSQDSPFRPFVSFCPLVESISYVGSTPHMGATSTRLRHIVFCRSHLTQMRGGISGQFAMVGHSVGHKIMWCGWRPAS